MGLMVIIMWLWWAVLVNFLTRTTRENEGISRIPEAINKVSPMQTKISVRLPKSSNLHFFLSSSLPRLLYLWPHFIAVIAPGENNSNPNLRVGTSGRGEGIGQG